MIGLAQFGIALGALGAVVTLMGLFPGVTGITPGSNIGLVQFSAIILGFTLLDLGAILYVKFTLYAGRGTNLVQQISIRISLTGIVLAAFTGLADQLGFGSHVIDLGSPDVFFGPLQAAAALVFLILAAVGVLIYAIAGNPPNSKPAELKT